MLYLIIIVFLWIQFDNIRHPKHALQLNVYFGVPGSGKTTFAAYLARAANRESIIIRLCHRFPCRFTNWILSGHNWKRKIPVYSNVPIKGTYKLDCMKDIGNIMIENGKMIIDEAGIEFNNRNHKEFPKPAIKFFKLHRHYGVSVDVFSQSHEDMEVTLRRLAQNMYVVKKSLIPHFIVIKRILRKVGIDENTHQLCDHYYFGLPVLGSKWIYCPPLWKLFDSYECPDLPPKDWAYWDTPTNVPIPYETCEDCAATDCPARFSEVLAPCEHKQQII